MAIPTTYAWLRDLPVLPRMVNEALDLFGTAEIVDKGSNRTIIGWRDELNQAGHKIAGYSDDDIPWCGLFVAIVAFRAGKIPVENPLWARNWAKFGVKADAASLGDVLVFVRDGGGHVGVYVGEDATCYHVLGGNQSNKVCFTRILKSRCIAVRRPTYRMKPVTVKPYHLAANGLVSSNEA